jgi:hypothetical protein
MPRAKKKIVIPLPKVKERGVMPKPTRVIPDPKKAARKKACRGKLIPEDEPNSR